MKPTVMLVLAIVTKASALALAAGLVLLGLAPTSAAGQKAQRVPALLVAVERSDSGKVDLDPIAYVRGRTLAEPPAGELGNDTATDAFARRYFAAGRRYFTTIAGARAGMLRVRGAAEGGCAGVSGAATIEQAGSRWGPEAARGIAFSDDPGEGGVAYGRTLTPEESSRVRALVQQVYEARRVSAALIGKMQAKGSVAVTIPGQADPVLFAAYEIQTTRDQDDRVLAVLVAARKTADGYRPAFTWYGDNVEAEIERPEIWDVADVDADGAAEVVVKWEYYESWNYGIMRRENGRWREIYRGGGGGC